MSKIKVGHIITRLVRGGAQENTFITIKGLKNKYDITLIGGSEDSRRGTIIDDVKNEGIKLITLKELRNTVNLIYIIKSLLKLYKIIKKERFDIVHTHSTHAGILGRIAAKMANTPIIIHTIHGLSFHEKLNILERNIAWFGEKIASSFTDKIISVSQVMIDKSLNVHIAKKNKFVLIRSGFDIDLYNNIENTKLKSELKIKNNDFVIMKICGLVPLKGCEDFIELANIICLKHKNVKFVLVGDGELRTVLDRKVTLYKLNKNFIFTGHIDNKSIPKLISISDLVVHLSYREGLARVIPQVLACGKPIISYDVDGAKELINKNNGFLIKEGDVSSLVAKIELLLNNRKLLINLSNTSIITIKKVFSKENMINNINKVYKNLIKYKSVM